MSLTVEDRDSAFQANIALFAIVNNDVHADLTLFLNDAFTHFEIRVNNLMQTNVMLKVQGCLIIQYIAIFMVLQK